MKMELVGSDLYLTTIEGYTKDRSSKECKRQFEERKTHLNFTGPDAPVKEVRAIMQKYGITVEDL